MSAGKVKKIKYDGREYRRRERDVLRHFYPSIYPCRTCGSPVARGYVCFFCDDSDPSSIERAENK